MWLNLVIHDLVSLIVVMALQAFRTKFTLRKSPKQIALTEYPLELVENNA